MGIKMKVKRKDEQIGKIIGKDYGNNLYFVLWEKSIANWIKITEIKEIKNGT